MVRLTTLTLSCIAILTLNLHAAEQPPATASVAFDEESAEIKLDAGVRVVVNQPRDVDGNRDTLVLVFALPNGNSIEQTMGSKLVPGLSWRYDIQHIAAQTRKLRQLFPERNILLACVEASTLSWPAWRAAHADNAKQIREIVTTIVDRAPGKTKSVALACHSGGGSFLFGYLNGGDTVDDNVERIAWLDANYSYRDDDHHGDKLLAWLNADKKRELVVIAYDDRNITLNGKKVVSDTGGTYRATHRMIDRFNKDSELTEKPLGEVSEFTGLNGQVHFLIHPNKENKILHTVLVERNGLIEAMTLGTPAERKWGGSFWGGRVYSELIAPSTQPAATPESASGTSLTTPAATIPPRPEKSLSGKAYAETIADLPAQAREQAIVQEVLKGNVPAFLRKFVDVTISGKAADGSTHTVVLKVSPDYLSIGTDEDFVRMPMAPRSATQIGEAIGCMLPTRKIVDAIYEQAAIKLEPRPMTETRESVTTFVAQNDLIEKQRAGKPPGELIAGIKKDVVLTNRLKEKPARVAIYGWHKLDGKPIQPLTIVHNDGYVDYSHGIRLVQDEVEVDGKPMSYDALLRDPNLSSLVSDEGPIDARYAP